MNSITCVGLDVHKATVSAAIAKGQRGNEVLHVGIFPNRPDHIARLVERLGRNGPQLSFCYEADRRGVLDCVNVVLQRDLLGKD
jgi:hypothetical protein